MLRALGHRNIARFHMNEGHAGLLAVALLDEQAQSAGRKVFNREDVEAVRGKCVFTTHAPVTAGHDRFPTEMAMYVLGRDELMAMKDVFCCDNALNMTYLALNLSHYVNGVVKKHGEVSRLMFAGYAIDAITNGVHVPTWTSPASRMLFDRYIPGWREDSFNLRYALSIPPQEVWAAHSRAKIQLIKFINRETNAGFEMHDLALGFARRAASCKRGDLLFHDVERLRSLVARAGRIQLVYAGKAHRADKEGNELIKRILRARDALRRNIKIAYLENYDMELAKLLTAGVDVWLNTPQPPLEASGTSGMKAAINGVPSLSTLDGWWIEGCKGVTGWAVDSTAPVIGERTAHDALSLYNKLEQVVIPLFYRDRSRFIDTMRHAIALNGSFFSTQRMLLHYVSKAYFP